MILGDIGLTANPKSIFEASSKEGFRKALFPPPEKTDDDHLKPTKTDDDLKPADNDNPTQPELDNSPNPADTADPAGAQQTVNATLDGAFRDTLEPAYNYDNKYYDANKKNQTRERLTKKETENLINNINKINNDLKQEVIECRGQKRAKNVQKGFETLYNAYNHKKTIKVTPPS